MSIISLPPGTSTEFFNLLNVATRKPACVAW